MPFPFVSVVIVSFNSKDDLSECLPSLFGQGYPECEVIVVDNASTDGTPDFVENSFPLIKVIRNENNCGCAKGYNIGISQSRGKYVVLLNPDTVVEREWLRELVRVMETDESIAACQSRVLLYGRPDTINTQGNDVNYLGFAWCRKYGEKNSQDREIQQTLGLSVCSAILRRDATEKAGLFDEDFFMYLDDTDLGLRLYLQGYKIVCNPASIVYHKYTFKPSKAKMYYLERNRLVMLLKVYDKATLLKILPIFVFMELGLLGLSVFQGWFMEKVKSYAWIILRWRSIRDKRKNVIRRKAEIIRILSMMSPKVTFEEIQNPLLDKLVDPLLGAYYRLITFPQRATK